MSFTTSALQAGVPTTSAETGASHTDELYDALAHEHRRAVLDAVASGEELSVETLAERLLVGDSPGAGPTSGSEPSSEARERVTISLVHVHLPKLAAVGLIEYDRDRNRVAAS